MRNFIKIVIGTLFVILVIFTISVFILLNIVNPNDYKNRINEFVYNKTGHHLILGNVGWSFIPWLGVDLKQVVLSNPKGFTASNLLQIREIKVKVRFWPLLIGHVHLDKIIVDQAKFNLIKDKNGHTNFSDWVNKKNLLGTTNITKQSIQLPISELKISGIYITNSEVNLINQKTHSTIVLKNINLKTGAIANISRFPISLQFDLTTKGKKTHIETNANGEGNVNILLGNYRINNMNINLIVRRPNLPILPIKLNTNLSTNLKEQIATLSPLNITLANMQLSANVNINRFKNVPMISANLNTDNTNLKLLLMTLLGKSLISGQLFFDTTLTTYGNSISDFLAHLNGNGKFSIQNGAILGIRIDKLSSRSSTLPNSQTQLRLNPNE